MPKGQAGCALRLARLRGRIKSLCRMLRGRRCWRGWKRKRPLREGKRKEARKWTQVQWYKGSARVVNDHGSSNKRQWLLKRRLRINRSRLRGSLAKSFDPHLNKTVATV